jgi:phosphate acyltransferase
MVTVAVDANGADLGPAEVAAGAALAAARGIRVRLYGPAAELGAPGPGVEVSDAPVSIAKAADPAHAARRTPESSIVRAARAVGAGEADALVSGGSTGSALAAGLFHMKRAKGIFRPALALQIPIPDHPFVLLDVGANAEVRPEHLVQFAFMGAAFAEAVLGVTRPRVGLLSNGEEPTKGTPDVIAVHEQLAARREGLNFVGNVEGHGLSTGAADVVVTDGFTGNVALKILEGASGQMVRVIRERALRSNRGRLGGLMLRPSLRGLRDEVDPEHTGGAFMLGLRRAGVVAHGRFTRHGFARAIEVAARAVEEDAVGRTHAALEAAGVLRTPSEAAATVPTP